MLGPSDLWFKVDCGFKWFGFSFQLIPHDLIFHILSQLHAFKVQTDWFYPIVDIKLISQLLVSIIHNSEMIKFPYWLLKTNQGIKAIYRLPKCMQDFGHCIITILNKRWVNELLGQRMKRHLEWHFYFTNMTAGTDFSQCIGIGFVCANSENRGA